MTGNLMVEFNKRPKLGVISTSNKRGEVDSAVCGSPWMVDEKMVVVGLTGGRTFANLQENPNAVYLIIWKQGEGIFDWKGIRVYLRMKEYVTSGPVFDDVKKQTTKKISEKAADMLKVFAKFEVTEVRPLIDLWQGWEKSIQSDTGPCQEN